MVSSDMLYSIIYTPFGERNGVPPKAGTQQSQAETKGIAAIHQQLKKTKLQPSSLYIQ
jgi:hypothetical protein